MQSALLVVNRPESPRIQVAAAPPAAIAALFAGLGDLLEYAAAPVGCRATKETACRWIRQGVDPPLWFRRHLGGRTQKR